MEQELTVSLKNVLKASKVSSVDELSHSGLMKMNKDNLVTFVQSLSKQLPKSIDICKAAAGKIDDMKTQEIETTKKIVKLQEEQLDSVQNTVNTEIQSWSEIVQKNCVKSSATVRTVQQAVKSVVEEETRSKNFIIYGAKDWVTEDLSATVDEVFDNILLHPAPEILAARRIGTYNADTKSIKPRPIKVTLASSGTVENVLSNARKLSHSSDERIKKIFLAPDRSKEERLTHKKLVTEIKRLIDTEPLKHHFVRNGRIISVDKKPAAE